MDAEGCEQLAVLVKVEVDGGGEVSARTVKTKGRTRVFLVRKGERKS